VFVAGSIVLPRYKGPLAAGSLNVEPVHAGVSDYGAGEMSGPLPKFSAAKAGAAADGDATAQSAGTDITAAAASQWASYGFLGDDTGAVAPAAAAAPPAAAPALEHPHAAAEAAPAANAASPPAGLAAGTPAGAEEDAGADSVAALDAAFGAVAGGRRLSGSPDGSGSMAPGADTPTRDLTHNITAAMGGLSTLLEEDEEWLSGSRSRTTSPGGLLDHFSRMKIVFELSTWFAGCWETAEIQHRQSSCCSHIPSPVGSAPKPGGKPPFLPCSQTCCDSDSLSERCVPCT